MNGRTLGEPLRAGPWLWDLMDFPTPHTVRVQGPRPWVDVTHPYYGVQLGTGKTTAVRSRNARACQQAIDDAQTDGGMLYIPGVIELNANLTMSPSDGAPLYLRGSLWQRSKLLFIGNYGLRVNGTYSNIHISHLTLDCSGGGTTNNYGLYTTGSVVYLSLEKVWFESGFNIGLFAEDTYHVNLRRVFFEGLNGIVAERDDSDQAAQWMLDECHFNPSNGVQALKITTGGEIYIVRGHFQNYLSNGSVAGSPLSEAVVYLTACDSVTFDNCTFEGNNPNVAGANSADILLEDCGTVKIDNCKWVSANSPLAVTHDFIRVRGPSGGAGNGCANLVIDAASINGDFTPGVREDYFVQWLAGATGSLTISGGVNQTGGAAIPLITGTPTNVIREQTGVKTISDGLVMPKASGKGTKVDIVSPTFPWRDILGDIMIRSPGASDPTLAVYQGNIRQFQFSQVATNEVYNAFHVPHDYVLATDIHIHVHWSQIVIDTGGPAGVPGNVKWYFDVSYAKGHNQAAFSAPVTASVVQTASGTQYQHMLAEVQLSAASPSGSQIDTDNLEPDGIILVRTYRNPADAADTLDQGPFLHYVDIHYQSTSLGTKQKAPNFYT